MDNVEGREQDIYNKDKILGQIETIIDIKDQATKAKEIKDFVDTRVESLIESSAPKIFMILSRERKGFIHPDSEMRRSMMVNPFQVDDPQIYQDLIEKIDEFKNSPGWEDIAMNKIVPTAVLFTIGQYFGNYCPTTNTENNNKQFYLGRSSNVTSENIHLNEFKGKEIGVCIEKSAVAQNLLSFLGYQSELIASTRCEFDTDDKDDRSAHVYNIITTNGHHLIFDPANPTMILNDDNTLHSVLPAFYEISTNDYKDLIQGGQVEVSHQDGNWDGNETHISPPKKRIYGGPSHAMVS